MNTQPTPELKYAIKQMVLDALKFTDIKPESVIDDASLFDGSNTIQIDSVDALEIVMALQKTYKVHIDDQNPGKSIIKSIDTIAEFVAGELAKKASGS
jgi:acyl carrier protein